MTEQKLDNLMREYFNEKEELSPELKRKIRISLSRAEAGRRRRQFLLLTLAVSLYSIGIFMVCGIFWGTSPLGVGLLVNMCLVVAGSGGFALIAGKQNKYKEA